MTLLLRWRRPDLPMTLQWRSADRMAAQHLAANPDAPIAAIIGPIGLDGPAGIVGPTGPAGPAYDLDNAIIDGGTFN